MLSCFPSYSPYGHAHQIAQRHKAYHVDSLSLIFLPPQSNKYTKGNWKTWNAQQQAVTLQDQRHSSTLSLSVFITTCRPGSQVSPLMAPRIILHAPDAEAEAWRTRIVSAEAKVYHNREPDLKDSSRLKLIEITFVVFGVFYVSFLSGSGALMMSPKWAQPRSE